MWAIILSFAIPEIGTLIRAARICFFKNIPRPSWGQLAVVTLMESFHVAGLAMLVFIVFPNLDAVKAAMLTNCVCLVPGILGLLSRSVNESKLPFKYTIDVLAISAQITGFVVWPLLSNQLELWFIPVSVFLVSCHWWENYLSLKSYFRKRQSITPIYNHQLPNFSGPFATLANIKEKLTESRYYTYLFMAPYKIVFFLSAAIFVSGQSVTNFFAMFATGWGNHTIVVREVSEKRRIHYNHNLCSSICLWIVCWET